MSVNNLIDPIDVNLTGNTSYEDLFIYVDMYAERRGFTVLDNNNISTSESSTKVNLLGFRHKVNKADMDNIFTTDYSIIYDNNGKDIGATFEGFGIKSINIETNASYVPKVLVEFVDIKGMSFFNKNKDSPYSLLFDFPPPIFTLVIKGYYGGALEYKLHLLRQNTKFDAETGNFYINAEFVGNTFAPLTDLLFQNVLLAPKLINEKTNISDRSDSSSLADLISKAKTIKNDIIEKIKDEDSFKELTTKNEDLQKIGEFINKNLLEGSGVKLVQIIISDNVTELNSFDTLQIGSKINNIDKNKIRYFIISKPIGNVLNANIIDLSTNNLFKFYDQTFKDHKIDVNVELNAEFITTPLSPRLYKIKDYNKLDYIDITETILNIKNKYDILSNNYSQIYEKINEKTGELIKKELGFTPTIYNVMDIILKDVGIWLNELINVYNESITYLNDNEQQFKNLYSNNVTKFYPFPDFVDDNIKVFPDNASDVRANMPEIKFTKKFINEFVNRKKDQTDKEKALISNLTNNDISKWYPTNYYNSFTFSKDIVSPYVRVTNINDLFKTLFSRYYIYRYFNNFTVPDNELFLIDNLTNRILFFRGEVENILLSLDNKIKINLRDQIINLNTDNKIKEFIVKSFKDFPNINIIKDGFPQSLFNIDNFEGIKFSNKKLIPTENNLDFLDGRRYVKDSYSFYKFSKKNIRDFGITLSENNDIYYYDGKNENETSFDLANKLEIKLNTINDNIYNSIVSNTNKNKILNDIINIAINNEDKLFGILNIIYVPNINHINSILLNKTIISDIPYLVKIFISSYVYDITNNNSINYNKIIGFGSNQFNILNNNFYTPLLDFKNRIINLSESDKNNFINFYNNQVLENFSNFELFINKFLDNNKFITKNSDIEKLIKDNINKIEFIKKKSLYINSSDYTFSTKNSEFFNNFSNDETIIENLIRILNLKNTSPGNTEITFIDGFKILLSEFNSKTKNLKLEDNIVDLEKTPIDKSFNSVKLETYYSIKSFVDRWMTPVESQSKTNVSTIFNLGKNNQSNNLIDLFSFVDRAYNENIAKNAIVDISILAEFENDYNVNMLTVIGKLLNENGFEFYPLQNFMVFNADNNDWDSNNIFRPKTTDVNITNSEPKFTCIYVGGTSKYLDSLNNSTSTFKNDGIDEFESAKDFNNGDSKTQGFRVRFGDGRQSVFTSIDVGTEEFQPTNESLEAMSLILDGPERAPVSTAQNLFSVYEQRSYTCKVKMFGNAMIQPTQFFMLENIPMFNGLYLILKVSHSIDGENNSIMTEFEGVRLPKEPRPFITQPYDVYIKNIIGNDLLIPNFKITENKSIKDVENRLDFPKKDRTVYLIAGHDKNDPGAIAIDVNGAEIRESDYTKEFRDLLKRELDNKSIKNDIDNDDLSLNQVIADLNTKINEDDIVIDIHFNAFGDNANGTEVVIKNAENDDIITLASKFANQIVKTLGTNLRRGGDNLPKGVISQSQTQRERLAIFENLNNNNVILIEICFIDNFNDRTKYENNKELLAKEIVNNILSKLSTTENDTKLDNLQTFDILNELKYDKINNRPNPYTLPNQNLAKNLMTSLFRNHNFSYTAAGSKIKYISNSTGPFIANKPKTVYLNNNEQYFNNIIKQLEFTSEKYKIDILLLFGIIAIESKFQPSAVSSTGAFGIGQFILSSAMLEILRTLQNKPNNTSKVLIFENNNYIEKTINNKSILNILFSNNDLTGLRFEEISSNNIVSVLKNKKVANKSYAEILIQNIFDNPFISIELSGLYLNIIENYVKTKTNKNLGVLTLSYNAGNKGNNYTNNERIYFNYIISKYQKSTEKDIKQLFEEGVLYPERLINEIFIPLNIIGTSQSKSKVVI